MNPLHDVSDAVLVIGISRYQEQALAETYRRHAGAVYGLARRLLANAAMAEEIVQEVFLRLWNQPDRFDPERGSLRSYLLAQCHGRSVDLLRSETSRRGPRGARRPAAPPRRATTSSTRCSTSRWPTACGSRWTSWPTASVGPSSSAYLGGKTYREVAAMLGEPEGTVKSRIRSGLKKMRVELIDAGIGGPA